MVAPYFNFKRAYANRNTAPLFNLIDVINYFEIEFNNF